MRRVWVFLFVSVVFRAVAEQRVELIADSEFQQGFQVVEEGVAFPPVKWNEHGKPVWKIAHHHSKSSFSNREKFQFRKNGLTFDDGYGLLDVHPLNGEGDVVVGMNADREFGGIYRLAGDPWPHLYVTQRIGSPGGHLGDKSPSLADMSKIDFSIGVRLLGDRPNKKEGYSSSRHAAQFLLLFSVQNLNRKSPGYGDYFWFIVALYDDREPLTRLHVMRDKSTPKKKATEKLIYSVGIGAFTSEIVAEGHWVTISGDLLPHIRAGLQEAWRQGYLPDSHDPADYKLGGLIFGWEVTGLNEVAVAIKDLRATAWLRDSSSD